MPRRPSLSHKQKQTKQPRRKLRMLCLAKPKPFSHRVWTVSSLTPHMLYLQKISDVAGPVIVHDLGIIEDLDPLAVDVDPDLEDAGHHHATDVEIISQGVEDPGLDLRIV